MNSPIPALSEQSSARLPAMSSARLQIVSRARDTTAAMAVAVLAACGGGSKKDDDAPTDSPTTRTNAPPPTAAQLQGEWQGRLGKSSPTDNVRLILIVSGVSVSGELQFLNPADDAWVHAGVLTGRIGGESPVVLTSDSMVSLSFTVENDMMSGSAELPDIDDALTTDLVASRS